MPSDRVWPPEQFRRSREIAVPQCRADTRARNAFAVEQERLDLARLEAVSLALVLQRHQIAAALLAEAEAGTDPGLAHLQALDQQFMHEAFRAHGREPRVERSEEHTSELQSLMRTSYAVFCLKHKRKA